MSEIELTEFEAADRELVSVAKGIKILSLVAWPPRMATDFIDGWKKGRPKIPSPPDIAQGFEEQIPVLERLAHPLADHPVAHYLAKTADSYLLSAKLLNNAGTPSFTEISRELYGEPGTVLTAGGPTNLDAAQKLLAALEELAKVRSDDDTPNLSAEQARDTLADRFGGFFKADKVEVVVDEGLASKAGAGAERVRLRGGARFSQNDVRQLVQHEGFVHTATALNGRKQTHFKSLSLPAPRTTATQEGLATFAEFITNSIDLNRLRRIALRVVGVHQALEGADFIDLFRLFLEGGQGERESFHSAMRCFRGGDPKGRIAFTKDVVYFRGLVKTQAFFLKVLTERKVETVKDLFAGRMTWDDASEFGPLFRSGSIKQPKYVPEWASALDRLAAYLAFSNLTHRLPTEEAASEVFSPLLAAYPSNLPQA